jgi:hypothetical protein
VTLKAPPPPSRKKAAEKVKCNYKSAKSKKKAIASSNNNSKDMAYVQPFAALAKGLNKPLAFSLESNQWYTPVDGTSLVGSSLNVKDIRPEPVILPGNSPKELNHSTNICMQHHHWCKHTHLNDDSSNDQNIHAYSLSKDNHKTGEVIESPPIKLPTKSNQHSCCQHNIFS